MTQKSQNKWSEVSFKPIEACTCADFNNHYFYACPDSFCGEIHNTCEDNRPLHQTMFEFAEVKAPLGNTP